MQRGSAVLIVLIFLVLLSSLVTILSQEGRTGMVLSNAYKRRLNSDLLTEAALTEVIIAYLGGNPKLKRSLPPNGLVKEKKIDGSSFRLSVTAESGKIDLVSGKHELLKSSFQLIDQWRSASNFKEDIFNIRKQQNTYDAYFLLRKMAVSALISQDDVYKYFTIYSKQAKLDRQTIAPKLLKILEASHLSKTIFKGRQRAIYTFSAAYVESGIEQPGKDIVISIDSNGQYQTLERRYRIVPMSWKSRTD